MGFHVCEYCGFDPKPGSQFSHFSSGDVTMFFDSGGVWEMPDMIKHYVADHGWDPPVAFIDDVMNHNLVEGRRAQTKSPASLPRKIAYLSGDFERGPVPEGFIERLVALMEQADQMGQRVQYRGTGSGVTGRKQYLGM